MQKRMLMTGGVILGLLVGCASAPATREERQTLEASASGTIDSMVARDPSLRGVLARAAGYVVFPDVNQGGFIVGGQGGGGVAYQGNRPIGYSELSGASVGLQAGGQSYSQLVVFETPEALARFREGTFEMSANAQATALDSGAAANAPFVDGVAVFISGQSGAMAGVSVAGENMSFTSNRPTPAPPPAP